ncbi:MAG TPA: prepilin-type N-terminal cleavage/methylation domain-containing protein [Vicinamibacteria bacterium]|nr:prepilin-type N-terminal cleavage/methylation domain-containing protein [Vicinamibacteria bacterium]
MASKVRENGFSMVELVVVISLIAILAAVSIPLALSFVRNYQITGAAHNVAAQMQMSRGQAVKRNTSRGILLNFNYPEAGRYQFTSLDPNPLNGNWGGGVYPDYSPKNFQEGTTNYGAVPNVPFNTTDPDPANGIMSPHGLVLELPQTVQFDAGTFNALLFRANGSVRGVNAAGGGAPVLSENGVDYSLTIRDADTNVTRTITISRNGRVIVEEQ